MNLQSGLPVSSIAFAFTWYGISNSIRSFQTSSGSPIETHTSVSRKSAPFTASSTSVGERDLPAALCRGLVREVDDLLPRPERLRARDPDVHAELRSGDQVAVRHVEAGVAQVAEGDLLERLVRVLGEREEVGEHLGRVPLVGEAVVDGDAGPLARARSATSWAKPRNSIASYIRPRTRAVSFAVSLWPMCEPPGPDEGDVRALVVGRDLEGTAGPRRVLLEDQHDLLADELLLLAALSLRRLQLSGQVDQVADLVGE